MPVRTAIDLPAVQVNRGDAAGVGNDESHLRLCRQPGEPGRIDGLVGGGQPQGGQPQGGGQSTPPNDPWATPGVSGGNDEPPF